MEETAAAAVTSSFDNVFGEYNNHTNNKTNTWHIQNRNIIRATKCAVQAFLHKKFQTKLPDFPM